MTRHAAIYCRVSTVRQDTRSQEPDLERWAAQQSEPVEFYRDKASGKTMDRPGWRDLEAAIDAGHVSRVVVWRLDRLGRTASGLTALFESLSAKGIGLLSLRDSLDLSTAAGRLMANVLASVAAYETEIRSERVKAGMAAAKAAGRKIGGSKPGRRKATPTQLAMIRERHAAGEKIARIARAVGLSRSTVYDVLRGSR